jgi:hypothetical protein
MGKVGSTLVLLALSATTAACSTAPREPGQTTTTLPAAGGGQIVVKEPAPLVAPWSPSLHRGDKSPLYNRLPVLGRHLHVAQEHVGPFPLQDDEGCAR